MGLMDRITSLGTSASRTPAGSSGSSASAVQTTHCSAARQRTASSSSLAPSPMYAPLLCR